MNRNYAIAGSRGPTQHQEDSRVRRRDLPNAVEPLERRRMFSAAPAAYTVTDLGTLGSDYAEAYGINQHGTVAGVSDTTEEFLPGFFINHAFRWDERSGMTDLGRPHVFSVATNINDHDDVAGAAEIPGVPDPVNGGNAGHPVVWDKRGRLTDLGTAAGKVNGTAWAVNDKGDAVGWAYDTDPETNPITSDPNSVPFVYDKKYGTSALPTPAGFKNGFAGDINESGVAAGYAANDTSTHTFVWTPGPRGTYTATDLGLPPGFLHSTARAINDRGVVAGQGGRGAAAHAFVWVPDTRGGGGYTPIDLGTLGTGTSARDINNRGDVVGVGRTRDGEFHAFLHDGVTLIDLNDQIPADSGWVLDTARSINDRGQIVGLGFHDDLPHAFLLDPAPAGKKHGNGPAANTAAVRLAPTPPTFAANGIDVVGAHTHRRDDDGGDADDASAVVASVAHH